MPRKQLFILSLGIFSLVTIARSQAAYDSSFHYYYYDQKLSLFEKMPAKKNLVVWLGDSITDNGEWCELFPGQPVMNRGISSDNTFGVLNRIGEVTRRKPRKIFIMIGINDIARGIPDPVIIQNYRRIIDSVQLQTPATRIMVQSILPTNNEFSLFSGYQNKMDHIRYVNRQLQIICAEKKLDYINLFDAFVDHDGKLDKKYTNDGVHLTGDGYLHWKEVLISGNYIN